MPKRRTLKLTALLSVVVGLLVLPNLASACTVPGTTDPGSTWTDQTFSGKVTQDKAGGYVQVPFNVAANTTAIRVRYCYQSGSGNTMDMGVYEPLKNGHTVYGPQESRGWSGSAVRDLAIAVNGYTPAATYNANPPNYPNRKDYVHGFTTRAYQAGAIQSGQWITELGLGALVTPGMDGKYEWTVKVETTTDTGWSNAPYSPVAYDTTPAKTEAGWYTGDLHAHGEEEPGNALMEDDFNSAFKPKSEGGPGLDFITLVDHNNIVSKGEIGRYQADHPGKLIIPGTEETTYHGHFNNQGSGKLVDFRTGPIYSYTDNSGDGTYAQLLPATTPKAQFAEILDAGGWTQINHPAIFPPAPDAIGGNPNCRGCFWEYSDADTDFSLVSAIEVQTGFASFVDDSGYNPYTQGAIDYYEHALSTGAHIAAVGSSDSHKNAATQVGSDTPIGDAATVVHADELSEDGITAGIKGAHTYVKMYGPSGPDVRVTGIHPNLKNPAILGDTMKAPSATFKVNVTGSGSGAARAGQQVLWFLKNGVKVASTDITSDNFTTTFKSSGTGRYSVEIVRGQYSYIELYSSPIWFKKTAGSNKLVVQKVKPNKKKGTAAARVKLPSTGVLTVTGSGARKVNLKVKKPSTANVTIKPTGRAKKSLKKTGKAKIKVSFRFTPEGGKPKTVKKTVKLLQK